MRLFEILLLLLDLLLLLFGVVGRRSGTGGGRLRFLLPAAIAIVLIAHLTIEGYRWQMIPAYLLSAILILLSLRRPSAVGRRRSLFTITAGILGLLFWLVAAALSVVLPVPHLPELQGPYRVGTVVYHLVDEARPETYTDAPDDRRELMVQVWYPAEAGDGGRRAPYMADVGVGGPAVARSLDLPPFLLGHLGLARMRATIDAPVLAEASPYPLLIFSHGLGGMRMQNTFQVEELASQGYVVAAIDHSYGAAVTVFPDGRVALYEPAVLGESDDEFDGAAALLVSTWAEDIHFVLDHLAARNMADADGRLTGQLDLEQVGFFGHSTGGAAALLACYLDGRCDAALIMDGWLNPVPDEVVAARLEQPVMFMKSESWMLDGRDENNERTESVFRGLQNEGYLLVIAGTNHYDFSDLPRLSPLTFVMGLTGPIGGRRVHPLINDYSLAFFNQSLKGEALPLLAGPSAAYPEVHFETHD